jgi:hypothetical protein
MKVCPECYPHALLLVRSAAKSDAPNQKYFTAG